MDKGFSKNDMLGKCHSLNGDGSNPPVTKKKHKNGKKNPVFHINQPKFVTGRPLVYSTRKIFMRGVIFFQPMTFMHR